MLTKNLKIIGTSHIAKQSVIEITNAMDEFMPDIVAVELDINRYNALISKSKHRLGISEIMRIGVAGYIFAMVGRLAQTKLGKIVNMEPGADMLSAINLAKNRKIKIALIDQNIMITLRRFSMFFTWREKFRLIGDVLRAIFFPKREIKRLGLEGLDLTKVPSKKLIKTLVNKMKNDYPNVYRVLLHERDSVMADNVLRMMKQEPDKKIMAVVGAAHMDGIIKLLRKNWLDGTDKKNEQPISYSFSVGQS